MAAGAVVLPTAKRNGSSKGSTMQLFMDGAPPTSKTPDVDIGVIYTSERHLMSRLLSSLAFRASP